MASVVILAGGKSRRMGRDKLSLPLDGKTLLESAVSKFRAVFENVYISVSDGSKYPEIDAQKIADIFPGAGPLSGLHAALKMLSSEDVFLVAADLPFSNPLAAIRLIELCGDCDACLIRLPNGMLEPLFGFYRSSLIGVCEAAMQNGEFKMMKLFDNCKTRYVEPEELGQLWNDRLIFNVNYPEDFEELRKDN